MRLLRLIASFTVLACVGGSAQAATRTFYIDYASGSDANAGTSTAAPWQHANGMQGCNATCAATLPQPGDQYIFKGGVTWPAAAFEWALPASGTASAPIYYGVNKTWYSGASWTRPIFDGQWSTMSTPRMIKVWGKNYLTFDNLELKDLHATTNIGAAFFGIDTSNYITIRNCYLHGWYLDSSITNDNAHGGIYVTTGQVPGVTVEYTEISNVEYSQIRNSGVALFSVSIFRYGSVHDVSSLCVGCYIVHDSTFYDIGYPLTSFDPTYHTNGLFLLGQGAAAYNNLFYNFNANAPPLYMLPCHVSAGPYDWTQYAFNNVVLADKMTAGPVIGVTPSYLDTTGNTYCGTAYILNNTIYATTKVTSMASWMIARAHGTWFVKAVYAENNHVINSDGSDTSDFMTLNGWGAPLTLVKNNNVFMSNAAAAAQGYTTTNYLAPATSSTATVMNGVNLASLCAGADLTALCTGTTAGGTAVAAPRPALWDTGAYQPPRPLPPRNVHLQ